MAGGRLPPLQYICSGIPCFQCVYHSIVFPKMQKTMYIDVGAATCRPPRFAYNPYGQPEPPTDYVIPSERSEPRNLPKWQILPCGGTFLPRSGFLHSANAAVGMTEWGYVSTDSPTVSRVFHTAPPPSSVSPTGRASFPRGKLLYRVGWEPVYSDVVLSGRFPERHIGRSLQFRWWVVPFIRTSYIRGAPGTAHRPFPTVSLKGVFFQPGYSKDVRCILLKQRAQR